MLMGVAHIWRIRTIRVKNISWYGVRASLSDKGKRYEYFRAYGRYSKLNNERLSDYTSEFTDNFHFMNTYA